ncbi:MAG: hypothetical protein IM486_05105 [Microcystis sp. M114S2]|jgi:hypothetical protein|uniref:hypothetical protein n=1 Tax=unclassified Microcystis TaxID=2643300 RepID=UPI002582B3B5|nr:MULTISPECIES: hypothetical protein [unclassified Microcystis]MDJ0544325.1 hypothetical protein [Microcystis sp. M53601_WE4]NCR74534.1 hypothetical protein [Microcystis aeruginosa K13-06]MCA2667870.1 hypothetical protein [Microcystis sp. M045S2]MCA2714463.1 hypothetical protein [Microcystis sp. M172S2]MCA2803481.1 hypothetical protein [Microcystis sp. M114S2]
MNINSIQDNSLPLEQRVTALETELLEIKQKLTQTHSWWLKIAGSFEEDQTFDEVVKLGQEWRKSVE